MYKTIAMVGVGVLVGACGYVSEYEKAVYGMEPTYCYKSIGKVACYKEPFHRDEKRLVNYFGPDPSRYDKPDLVEPTPIQAPKMVNYWVKDAEPIPRPAPTGRIASLPWLDPAMAESEAKRLEFARLSSRPDGTRALLNTMGIGPHGPHGKMFAKTQAAPVIAEPVVEVGKRPEPLHETPQALQPAPKALPKPPVVEVEVEVN